MFILDANIRIGDFLFPQVNGVKITKSVDLLSDTAEVKLPMSALFGNRELGYTRKQLEGEIKAGDKVSITLAYLGVFEKEEFVGYVRWIKPNVPTITIECEDAIYLVRQKTINKNFKATTLKKVLQEIVAGTGVELAGDIPDVNFDKFILKNVNGAEALEKIREEYGLYLFIDDAGLLYAGLRQTKNIGESVSYDLYRNVVKHDLKFRRAEDVRIALKVVGVQKDNTKVTVVVGDLTGEQRTIYRYNVSDKEVLKKLGEAELSELKYTGYEGTITGFLVPYATRGMTVNITDENYPERAGSYFVPKVTTTFGTSGARREVELGSKV
ncbi:MAG: late control protein [Leeuwenhoekiella sp.]|nr:late control protein [Leeuwenhoekiella sp.]MBH13562.1 late control protein [Leeuwenhoekiella sp.]HAX15710.1 late control protein [Leeuwenhoekiella sp.]|tara:strand:- start:17119 stop:18096 length:978 start_codon:yes stop_codon:yes gene_type:complete